jgi:hypothetical protein
MNRNRLTDLQAFATVARLRSFRRAATELGVSPSALSHSLRGLEGRLGVRLLNRSTRSVAPTEAGQRLLDRLAPALLDIDSALEALNAFRDSPVGTLRFNAPRHAAEHVLAPLPTASCSPTRACAWRSWLTTPLWTSFRAALTPACVLGKAWIGTWWPSLGPPNVLW